MSEPTTAEEYLDSQRQTPECDGCGSDQDLAFMDLGDSYRKRLVCRECGSKSLVKLDDEYAQLVRS